MDIIDKLQLVFIGLNSNTVDLLDTVYQSDMVFQDPLHKIDGLNLFKAYCGNLYQNVKSCRFVFNSVERFNKGAVLEWEMHLCHPKLNKGKSITVNGISLVRYNDKVYFHRDYFDLGAMLYEHIPLLGYLIKNIKSKVGKS